MKRDLWGRRQVSEQEIIEHVYKHPDERLNGFAIEDPTQYNKAVAANYSDLPPLQVLESILISPEEWHKQNQQNWHMPEEYRDLDIVKWVLDQCVGETELQRCGMELLEYGERDLLPLLRYLKYFVDTMRANKIVWGVGRGSSVASFVLYKIGIHHINSITFELEFNEFMR